MKNQLIRIKKNFRGLIIASLLILVFPLYLSAQDFWEATVRIDEEMQLIGGPYTTDEHTVLLLHFENNLDNVSTLSADGEAHGNLTYGDNTVTGFGKCLQIDNDAAEDLSYVTVADTAALDLTGDWTIEGWFNIATIGEAWMTDPRLIAKPGDSPWYNMNFYINLLEGGILSGFRGTSAWPEVTAPNSSLTLGEWLHVTYMHDSTKCLNIQMIHNAAKELIYFNYKQYDAGQNPPLVSDQSVSIGFGGGGNNSYLNGSVDEIRISNVLRDFAMPPIPLSQDVTVRFSVNMTNAVSYQTGEPFENLQSVFLNGDFCCESGWCGWTLDDTTSLIRLYDDGTNGGDVTADDNIWTTEVQFYDGDASANSYKYGAYDPDNMNLESLVPMDNEAGWGDDHSITIDDSSPLYIPPTDTWATIGTGSAPTVITLAETNITSSGVTLNGIVNPNGLSTTVIFEYGETTSYGDQITAEQSPLTGSSSVTVSANLSGLSDNTEYHYRVVATNSAGTANGADLTFTTLQSGSAPTTTTEAATDVSTTSATLNGTVNPNELSTTVIFEYGETASYGSQITADQSPVSGTTDVTVSANLTGLSDNTEYHYRVVATNSKGTTNGADLTFTTLQAGSAPTTTTEAATDVNTTSAILNGTVNPNELSTTVIFEYGETASYGDQITAEQSPLTGTSNVSVSANLTGLSDNTEYHYRVVATNSVGTTYGADQTFTTLQAGSAPTATTDAATDVNTTSATLITVQ